MRDHFGAFAGMLVVSINPNSKRTGRKRRFGGGGNFVMGNEFTEANYASLCHVWGGSLGKKDAESSRCGMSGNKVLLEERKARGFIRSAWHTSVAWRP